MYEKLLITAGGGIVPETQTSEQSEKNTNIFIGLGGTGKSCLKTIKKDIYTKLQSDNPGESIRTYKNASFLCVDSDKNGVDDGVGALAPQEFYYIGCQNVSAFITNPALTNDPAYEWLKSPITEKPGRAINIQDTKAGACGVRQAGRALFFQHAVTLKNKIESMIIAAKTNMPDATVKVHIFTGIGGGTGAGTFLDVCYLIRKLIAEKAWGDVQVFGYFFLPDVNLSNPALDTAAKEMIQCTGYASMKELDYCMNFANNGDSWNQFYGGFSINTTEAPVDYAYLITATDSNGKIQPNPYDYAMNVVSTFVMDFLVKQETEFTIDSVLSNVPGLIEHCPGKNHGANYTYLVLGASCTYMPFADVTTYITSKIFTDFRKFEDINPSENDIVQFANTYGFEYDKILRELRQRVPGVTMYDVDMQTLYDQALSCATAGQYPAILDKMYNDDMTRILGMLETNKKALVAELDRIAVQNAGNNAGQAASLVNRVYSVLIDYAKQYDKGPFYAAAFLHNVKTRDLTNIIDGMIKESGERIRRAQNNLALRDKEYEIALNNLKNSGVLGRKGKGKALVAAFHSWCNQSVELTVLQTMSQVLTIFKNQVNDLYSNYFRKLETVIRELQSTFDANMNAFAGDEFGKGEFADKILSISDEKLKSTLETEVEEMDKADVFRKFVDCLAKHDEWLSLDADKIVAIVNRHFVSELEAYTQKTIETYLSVKFETNDQQELQKKIYNSIVLPLAGKAAPLFWQSASYQLSNASSLAYCSVPTGAPLIYNALSLYNEGLPDGSKITLITGKDPGRINFLEMRCGVPFYGYQGLMNYANAQGHIGRFIYEGSERDARYWGQDYDIVPLSCLGDFEKTEEILAKQAAIKEAKEYGVFGHKIIGPEKKYEFFIKKLDEGKVKDLATKLKKQVENKNVDKIKEELTSILGEEVVANLMMKVSNAQSIDEIFIDDVAEQVKKSYVAVSDEYVPAVGSTGYELLCADDVVFSYKGYYGCMRENTALAKERYSAIKDAVETIMMLVKNAGLVQKFAAALCCGVIETSDNYTFKFAVQNQFGLTEETVLTNIDSLPYGEHLPLYSAYLAYAALGADVKQTIVTEVRNKKVNSPADVTAATTKVKAMFEGNDINSSTKMLQRATTSFALQAEDVKRFISELMVELKNI